MLMGDIIGIHQQTGVVSAYVATPPLDVTTRGAILLLHDIWGLTDHIKSVADRFAAVGYYVMAPDLLFTNPEKRQQADELQKNLLASDHETREKAVAKFRELLASTHTPQFASMTLSKLEACFEYVYNQPVNRQKVAVVGFGFGGTYAYSLAVRDSRLRAAVPFYGHAAYHELELRHIACPIMAFYGGGEGVSRELAGLTPHMAHAGVRFTPITYDDAGTSFFNDTNSVTYNRVAAEDSWHRLVGFLRTVMI